MLLQLGWEVNVRALWHAPSTRSGGYLSVNSSNATHLVALLLHSIHSKELPDSRSCVGADLLSPFGKALAVPLQIFLVILRHVRFQRAILVRTAVKPRMRGNSVAFEENLDRTHSEAHVYFLLDVLIWNGVVLLIHADVVIVLDCGDLPRGQLKRESGNGRRKGFSSSNAAARLPSFF